MALNSRKRVILTKSSVQQSQLTQLLLAKVVVRIGNRNAFLDDLLDLKTQIIMQIINKPNTSLQINKPKIHQ